MGTTVQKTFKGLTSWTAPAGVTQVKLTTVRNPFGTTSEFGMYGFIDPLGAMYLMGSNGSGQVGDNTAIDKSSPTLVVGGHQFAKVISFTTGTNMNAIDFQGNLYGWGANANGEVPKGTTGATSSPTVAAGTAQFYDITSHPSFSSGFGAGITPGGQVYAWGYNAFGNLGTGDVVNRSSPTPVVGGLLFRKVACTFPATLGLTPSGQLYGWGANNFGTLGTGDTTPRSSPVLVVGGLTFTDMSVGINGQVFATASTGSIYCWGANASGELGLGDTLGRSSPVLFAAGANFTQVFGGGLQTSAALAYGLTSTGALFTWGQNAAGELGVGDTNPRSTPTAVVGGQSFSKVIYGGSTDTNTYALGLTTTGQVYGWGYNAFGQLGTNDSANHTSPTAAVGGLTFSDISLINYTAYGLTTTGQVYSWGLNTNGQVGDGTTTMRSSPVQVVGSNPSHIARLAPTTTNLTLPVVPGATYSIDTLGYYALFGAVQVAAGGINSLVLTYEQ